MKKSILVMVAFLGVMAMVTAASALTLAPGPFQGKYYNWENFYTPTGDLVTGQIQQGDVNTGVFIVQSINSVGNVTPWFSTTANQQIMGYYTGITVQSVTGSGTSEYINSTGGTLTLYLGSGFDGTIASVTSQTPMVTFDFVPGVSASDPTITVSGTTQGDTVPITGTASGYLAVDLAAGGAWAQYFDGNFYNSVYPGADLYEISDYTPYTGSYTDGNGNAWLITSSDPFTGSVVPEPGTILLLGAGMLLMAGIGRKRFNKTRL